LLQWMDDFTSYGTDTNRTARLSDGPYAAVSRFSLAVDPDPTAGGNQVLLGSGGGLGGFFRKVLTSAQTTVGVAARYFFNTLPSAGGLGECPTIASLADINNITHCYVIVNPSGFISAYRAENGATDTLLGTSASPVVVTNSWRHIETKFVLDNAAGSIEVRFEGLTVFQVTGVKTTSNRTSAGTTAFNVVLASEQDGAGPLMYVKDFIIWDGSGAVNNNFMGSCQVYKIQPDSDVSLNWTPSTGTTGFNLINDTTPSDDTGYISAPTPAPSPAQFTLTDLPTNVTSVKGVMVIHRSRKTDGGDGSLQTSLISGVNTGNGSNRTITTAYTYWWDVFDQDPSGTNWSKTLVNALKLQLNRTV
jgi:hypothetical protein